MKVARKLKIRVTDLGERVVGYDNDRRGVRTKRRVFHSTALPQLLTAIEQAIPCDDHEVAAAMFLHCTAFQIISSMVPLRSFLLSAERNYIDEILGRMQHASYARLLTELE